MIQKDYQTLTELLERTAERFGTLRAMGTLRSEGTFWITYHELLEGAGRWASLLADDGVQPGDCVALQGESGAEWAAAFFGVLLAGAIAVPVDDSLPEEDRLNILSKTRPRAYIALPTLLKGLEDWAGKNGMNLHELKQPFRLPEGNIGSSYKFLPDDLACILFTSGTTGGHKGVMLTHQNLISNVKSICQLGLVQPRQRVLTVLPLHHCYAFTTCLLVPLPYGASCGFLSPDRASQLAEIIGRESPNLIIGVPRLYSLMCNQILQKVKKQGAWTATLFKLMLAISSWLQPVFGLGIGRKLFKSLHQRMGGQLKILVSGGAKLDPDYARTLTALGFNVCEGYGLTETSPVAAFNSPARNRIGTVGPPIPGVNIRIDRSANEKIGEVCIRGPNVFKGYYQSPEATNQILVNGELRTGDLGFFDKHGHLVLCGRKKDVIVLPTGKKIFPEEVENVIDQNPLVAESVLVEAENRITLLIVADESLKEKSSEELETILNQELSQVCKRFPVYARPKAIRVIGGPLPRTRLGKLRRHLVNAKFSSG